MLSRQVFLLIALVFEMLRGQKRDEPFIIESKLRFESFSMKVNVM